jgi:glycosyltransferase involved in cell wall biosynthesis
MKRETVYRRTETFMTRVLHKGTARAARVSIGLPVYNGERFIAEAIECALGQTYRDIELVICDNASTDGTRAICESYAASDERVRYHRNAENLGAARNFSRTFELARGELFKWLPADDLMAPDCIERCVAALNATPAGVLAYTQACGIDETGRRLQRSVHPVALEEQGDAVERFRRFREEHDFRHGVRAWPMLYVFGLIRSSVLRETGLIAPYVNSDSNLVYELLLAGRFVEVADDLVFFRHHEHSYSEYALDAKQRQQFFDPQSRAVRSAWLHEKRLHLAHTATILTSRLSLREKAALLVYSATWPRRRRELERARPAGALSASS